MNQYEFIACGTLLYGSQWKTDLAKSLGFSASSRMIAKIEKGERKLTDERIQILSQQLLNLSDQLKQAHEWINRGGNKIVIASAAGSVIHFTAAGILILDTACREDRSKHDIILYNAKPVESIPDFLSYVVSIAHHDATQINSNHKLIELIQEYFDLRMIGFDPDAHQSGSTTQVATDTEDFK